MGLFDRLKKRKVETVKSEELVKEQASERRSFIKAWEENTPYRTYTPQEIGITPEAEGQNRNCNNCPNNQICK